MKTIVIGYDATEPAKRALERAGELAKAFGAHVIVTSVARPLAPAGRSMGAIDPVDPPEKHEEEAKRASESLEERGLGGEYVVAVGDPADHIVELAEQRGADLIVVGTREPNLIERLLGLSVSDGVQRKAHCDVLIVH